MDLHGQSSGADLIERTAAERAVRESEERFRLAMNNVAAGVYTLDLQGLVTYVNPAAEAMFWWTNAELLGKKMHDVTHYKHPDGSPFPASDCPGLQVLNKGTELRDQEDVFIRKDGSFFPVVYSASPLKSDGTIVGIVVGFRDDTLRRKAERAVRESEERFRLIANSAPVIIWMSDVNQQGTYVNQSWADLTGRPLEAALGSGWADGIHPQDVDRTRAVYVNAFDRREPFHVEYRLRRWDGEYRWIVATGVPRFNVDGSFAGYIGSGTDVTDRKLAEEALSMVSQRLIEAQEEERTRIARELHDDIGQRLCVLQWRLDKLKGLPRVGELDEKVSTVREEVAALVTDIHGLSHRLHPARLEYLGLAAAAAELCSEIADRHGLEMHFQTEGIPNGLSPRISLCLYRVLQEALHNAVKHSGARYVAVSLKGDVDRIELTVGDRGMGFDPAEAARGRGLGLTSMKERVKAVDGQFSADSSPQRGTTIVARVPYTLNAAATTL